MGYDLMNFKEGYFHCNIWSWNVLLKLAKEFGWEPEGTTINPEFSKTGVRELSMNYYSNSHQVVRKTDADKIAESLEKALLHIPDVKVSNDYLEARGPFSGGLPIKNEFEFIDT